MAPDYRNGGNRITDVDDRASGGRPTWDGNEASNSNNWATIEGAWDPLHEANEGNWLSVRAAYERSAAVNHATWATFHAPGRCRTLASLRE